MYYALYTTYYKLYNTYYIHNIYYIDPARPSTVLHVNPTGLPRSYSRTMSCQHLTLGAQRGNAVEVAPHQVCRRLVWGVGFGIWALG